LFARAFKGHSKKEEIEEDFQKEKRTGYCKSAKWKRTRNLMRWLVGDHNWTRNTLSEDS
jgi:hypothetical protein